MSLTGTPFLYTTFALSVVALILPLALWSRTRGPRALRVAVRVLMLLFQPETYDIMMVATNNIDGAAA